MRRKMLEVMDRNGDGLIDYKEHMKHSTSPEGLNDGGWEVRNFRHLVGDCYGFLRI